MFGVIWSTDYVNILFDISQTQNDATVKPITIRKRDKKLPLLVQNLTPTRHGAEKNVTKSRSIFHQVTQAKKISFVETGKNAEYSIWGARKALLKRVKMQNTLSGVQENVPNAVSNCLRFLKFFYSVCSIT